ncbi:MAG: hypothetical protein QM661_00470 [Solimonas sp.]
MNGMILGVIILVVVLLVGPFATLRAVSYNRVKRRSTKASPPKADDDPDEPSDFW